MKRRLRRAAVLLVLAGCVLGIALVASVDGTLHAPQPSQLIVDRRGAYLGEVPGADDALGHWPPPEELPERIVRATLETEDRAFFDHSGVHLPSVLRAMRQNLGEGRIVSGASTLAMQVARMQSGPGGRTLWRKAREACEALVLVHRHGHDRVLRQYLTLAPYGHRVRGVTRAARMYFDKPVEDLSWLQAAYLAGLPQSPGRMDPWDRGGRRRGLDRAHRILRRLQARGVISADELQQALGSDLGLVEKPRRRPEALHAVLEWSRRAGERPENVLTSTLDLSMQSAVAEILERNLQRTAHLGAGNTAALVVDLETFDVLAWVGSADYFAQEARGAIDYVRTRRSPGSTLKPFIYALAMERRGFTAATQLPDTPMDLVQSDGRAFLPQNVNHAFLGPMLLRDALGNSRNIPALRALAEVGVEPTLELLERAGVSEIDWTPGAYGLGLAIGNLPVTLEELVTLYGALA
ncbi:MAG TPA: transglycosylase domain-containing protein, partial [Vulgatibacter sp.]